MKKRKDFYLAIIFILAIVIGIGYAALTSNLNIIGNTTIKDNTWDIHFENFATTTGSVAATSAGINQNDNTRVDYTVTLQKPGDFYEFTVDAVNGGSLDAMVSSVSNTGLTAEQENYITYSAKYEDGRDVEQKQLLAHSTSEKLKVRVEFVKDLDNADLPATDQAISLAFTINYEQADSTAIPKSVLNAVSSTSYNEELWSHRSKITKIVFQDEINEMPNASYTYDISEGNNKSVMANLVSNGNDTYTAYIQGDGKVYANENSSNLFYGFTILESIENIELLDTSKATNMTFMFAFCKELQNLDLSSFDTSNVTNMSYMFLKSLNMKKLDLTSFNTLKVTDMSYMFVGDNTAVLEEIDLSSFNTSNVTTMLQMFGRAMALKRLDLSNFNTSKVNTMYYMFYQCTNLEELNLKNFDMSAATTIDSLCRECSKLRTVTIDNFRVNKNTNTASIFYKCSELTGPPLIPSGADTIGKFAYGECRKLTGNIVLPEGIKTVKEGAFQHCVSLTGVLTLPSTLERIESFAFNHCESMQNTSLTIPKSVKFIGDAETYGTHVFYNFATNKITEYIVEAGNTKFKAEDGVLLSKDGTRLIAYPAMKPGDTYEMPEGITNLDELSFSRARNLKKLILPNSYTLSTSLPSTYLNVGSNLAVGIYAYTTINEIGVLDSNTKYKTIDGILYSKDGTTLWYVPTGKTGNVTIASGVTTIPAGAFFNPSTALNVVIPNTVTSISNDNLGTLKTLGPTRVTFEEGCVYHFNASGNIVKN